MSAFDLASTFPDCDVDSATNIFIDALHSSILQFIPQANFTSSDFPAWVSKDLKQLVRRKNKAHAIFKSTFDPLDYLSLFHLLSVYANLGNAIGFYRAN